MKGIKNNLQIFNIKNTIESKSLYIYCKQSDKQDTHN